MPNDVVHLAGNLRAQGRGLGLPALLPFRPASQLLVRAGPGDAAALPDHPAHGPRQQPYGRGEQKEREKALPVGLLAALVLRPGHGRRDASEDQEQQPDRLKPSVPLLPHPEQGEQNDDVGHQRTVEQDDLEAADEEDHGGSRIGVQAAPPGGRPRDEQRRYRHRMRGGAPHLRHGSDQDQQHESRPRRPAQRPQARIDEDVGEDAVPGAHRGPLTAAPAPTRRGRGPLRRPR